MVQQNLVYFNGRIFEISQLIKPIISSERSISSYFKDVRDLKKYRDELEQILKFAPPTTDIFEELEQPTSFIMKKIDEHLKVLQVQQRKDSFDRMIDNLLSPKGSC